MKKSNLTLQKKYTIIFSVIFLSILCYIIIELYSNEKRDLEKLSVEKFNSIFTSLNTIGEEALSVGDKDKLILKTILTELFKKSNVEGLEKVFFTNRDDKFFAYADKNGIDLTDHFVNDSLMTELASSTGIKKSGTNVFLTKSIVYKTASRDIHLGYSQLVYSLDHVHRLITSKQKSTIFLGSLSFAVSLIIIVIVTSILIGRIKKLHHATKEISEGIYTQLVVKGNDEISELTRSFNKMTVALKERLLMSRYISDSTFEQIKDQSKEINLGGTKEDLCIFFSDIRGFTSFSEKNDANDVVYYLNLLLDIQVDIIRRYTGDIDKFVGDEVMAIFRGTNKEINAINAAIEIQKKMTQLCKEDEIYHNLCVGIGINSGEVVTGNIGSKDRMDFTVIGDAVNTGARLCSNALANEIIISEITKKNIPKNLFEYSDSFSLDLKNKRKKLKLFKVLYANQELTASV
jgi:class 3 adenylate cyclase